MSCIEMLIGSLKTRRQTLGWSVRQVGERSGIDHKFLEQWESGVGSPRLEAVDSWASALGLRLSLGPAEAEPRRGLHVDWQAHRVSVDGTPIRLTPMEWKALERLAAVPGELVPHQDLFRHLYGEDRPYRAESTAIRVLITKLRRLLPLRIEAQWGRGYVISGISASSPAAPGMAEDPPEDDGGPEDEPAPKESAPERVAPERVAPEHVAPERVAVSSNTIAIDRSAMRRKFVEITNPEMRRIAAAPARPNPCRAEELSVIERFLAERGATRCPDMATIQHAPLPTLIWDKLKRKWVRPPMPTREAS